MNIKPIATIHNSFKTKFGIPRQSGMCNIQSTIIFEKDYNIKDAFRGIETFSHIWLIWGFSEFKDCQWSPTVRPPRLGGNKRVGVFATRSPHRPNSLGLSSVKLIDVIFNKDAGTSLLVSGADLMDGTPIYDIKPYVAFSDSHPDAVSGFSDDFAEHSLPVYFSDSIAESVPNHIICEIESILSKDPKPSYQRDKNRIYGMKYGVYEIKFKYLNDTILVISICDEQ